MILQAHTRRLREALDRLLADDEALIDAIVRDGWPRPMVETGVELHRRTWQADALIAAFDEEVAHRATPSPLTLPQRVAHIWPALPGAGVTPVLFGLLLGVDQEVRPSSRGLHFALYFADKTGIPLVTDESWTNADVVVVSASDETIAEIKDTLAPHTRLIAYGHRVSFALVVDVFDAAALDTWADLLATDVVLWHQTGCFSCRGIIFCGSPERAALFTHKLAGAIARTETRLAAHTLPDDLLARRAQAIGLASMRGPIVPAGLGWIQPTHEPFKGHQPSPHVVTLHNIDTLDALPQAIALPPHNLQGAALAIAAEDPRQDTAREALLSLGATRVCAPGELQAPPASWPHDGRPNVLDWLL